MENNLSLGRKGQASIEFIFLVIIILVYLHAILLPTVNYATAAANDAKRITEASFAAQKLADSINYVSSASGDSVQTISVFIPNDAAISCASSSVAMAVTLGSATGYSAACGGLTCAKSYRIAQNIGCGSITGPSMQRYKVFKIGGVISAAPS